MALWVKEGHEISQYPGWSRVLLTGSRQHAQSIQRDFGLTSQQVYTVQEWRDARGTAYEVQVAIDNADRALQDYVKNGQVVLVGFDDQPLTDPFGGHG